MLPQDEVVQGNMKAEAGKKQGREQGGSEEAATAKALLVQPVLLAQGKGWSRLTGTEARGCPGNCSLCGLYAGSAAG